jgi:hypothetical protein
MFKSLIVSRPREEVDNDATADSREGDMDGDRDLQEQEEEDLRDMEAYNRMIDAHEHIEDMDIYVDNGNNNDSNDTALGEGDYNENMYFSNASGSGGVGEGEEEDEPMPFLSPSTHNQGSNRGSNRYDLEDSGDNYLEYSEEASPTHYSDVNVTNDSNPNNSGMGDLGARGTGYSFAKHMRSKS